MRYRELDLRAFGPFTDRVLRFESEVPGLHLIFGPNEAGKSSLRRALRQLLFGIDEKTDDNFRHEYKALRLGGTLSRSDGTTLEFLRRKGRQKVLKTRDESAELDDSVVDRFLGGFDARQFEALFSLDHDALVAGGQQLSEGQGDLGELLFGAGTDLKRLVALKDRLEADAAALFKPRGEVPPLNQKLRELDEARRQIESLSLRSDSWHHQTAARRDAEQHRARIEAERVTLQGQLGRLNRLEQALPDLVRRAELRSILQELADAPRLPTDFAERRRLVETDRHAARQQAELAARNAAELAGALDQLEVPGPILDVAATVTELHARLLAHARDAAEIEESRVVLATLRKENQSALLDLGFLEQPGSLNELRSAVRQRTRIGSFVTEFATLAHEAIAARTQVHKSRQALTRTTEALELAESPAAVEPLRRELAQAQAAGDLAERVADADREADRLERKRDQAEAAFRIRPVDDRPLLGLPLPTPEQIDEFQDRLDGTDRAVTERQQALDEAVQSRDAASLALEAQRLGAPVPTEADLLEARTRRDQAWAGLRSHLHLPDVTDGPPGVPVVDLVRNHEQWQLQADRLADQLRHEADRVNLLASLTLKLQHAVEVVRTAEARLRRAQAAQEETLLAWKALWVPSALAPGSPRVMRAWLADHRRLVDCAREAELARQATEQQQVLLDRLERGLADRLDRLGVPLDGREPLVELIDLARQEVAHAEKLERNRQALEANRSAQLADLDQAHATLEEVMQRQSAWSDGWERLVTPLGLDPESPPEAAQARLDEVARLVQSLGQAEQSAERIARWDAERTRLESEARTVAAATLPESAGRPLTDLIQTLANALSQAEESRARREERSDSLNRTKANAQAAALALADAEARLAELMRVAGAATPEDLPAIEDRAEQRGRAERELAEVEHRLRGLSAGASLDSLAAEAMALEADAVAPERERLEAAIAALNEEFDRLGQEVGAARERLLQMAETAREARAVDAALRTQDLLTQIESDASRFVRLRLASAVLKESIERYRERSQGPVLKRASALFAQLTQGSFAGLTPEVDGDGPPRLVGVRPEGPTVPVAGMSEGTCDQLYLALKLAGIEHHLDHHEPMPFLADDILVNFDDGRSLAALRVLAQLGERTQVLFLTHHQHLVELARRELPAAGLFLHDLSRPG